jgi:hypothetical protein
MDMDDEEKGKITHTAPRQHNIWRGEKKGIVINEKVGRY